ncbi:MAG: ROK family protein [Proteobacteria bacterium]|nr:ROK family protein [Pseudomonadota bacterium]
MTAAENDTNSELRVLTIDIGGTGIKMLTIDGEGAALSARKRELTPKPSDPDRVLGVICQMIVEQRPFDRVSVGFPGVVSRGVVKTAHNLGTEIWRGFDLQSAIAEHTGKPTRVANDADLQGFGVIDGKGVEIVLTLGTGLGTALYVDGHLVPNLELAHHLLKDNRTYEDLTSDAELKRIGKEQWSEHVALVFEALEPLFNYDIAHLGGGNARHFTGQLPDNVRLFQNVTGLAGGIRLWQDWQVS